MCGGCVVAWVADRISRLRELGRADEIAGAEAFLWDNNEFRIEGNEDMGGNFNVSEAVLTLSVVGFPPGTRLVMVEDSVEVDDSGKAQLKTDVTALRSAVTVEELDDAQLSGITFGITPPGRPAIDIPLLPLAIHAGDELLLRAADGPLLFFGESAEGAEPPANVIWFHGTDHTVVGRRANTLGEIEAVAKAEHRAGEKRVCSGSTDDNGQAAPDLTVALRETVVTIHQRQTGKSVATKTFAPVNKCPTRLAGDTSEALGHNSVVPEDEIRAWLAPAIASG